MANEDVSVGYESLVQVAVVYEDASQAFRALLGPLNVLAQDLAGQSLVGETGRAAAQQLGQIKDRIVLIAQRCVEMSGDIRTTIQNLQTGDEDGAEKFDD